MAELGSCKTCKGKVSSEAIACPHCGQPDPYENNVSQVPDKLHELVRRNQKIEAIRVLKELQPWLSLKEAKDYIDSL